MEPVVVAGDEEGNRRHNKMREKSVFLILLMDNWINYI